MPTIAQIAARILLVTQAAWMVVPAPAQAQPMHHGRLTMHHAQHHRHMHPVRQPVHENAGPINRIPVGTFFNVQHQEAARAFYSEAEHQGYCTPGLKMDCTAVSKTGVWHLGQALPDSVVRFQLPRPLELRLGPPPSGHHYARVGADILLLTRHNSEVVDAIENKVR
jgi:Ni/Co efflux regulator RcnB